MKLGVEIKTSMSPNAMKQFMSRAKSHLASMLCEKDRVKWREQVACKMTATTTKYNKKKKNPKEYTTLGADVHALVSS